MAFNSERTQLSCFWGTLSGHLSAPHTVLCPFCTCYYSFLSVLGTSRTLREPELKAGTCTAASFCPSYSTAAHLPRISYLLTRLPLLSRTTLVSFSTFWTKTDVCRTPTHTDTVAIFADIFSSIKVFYLPTDAQYSWFKRILKFTLKQLLHVSVQSSSSSWSVLFELAKVIVITIISENTSLYFNWLF
jgi:hypothetical protein